MAIWQDVKSVAGPLLAAALLVAPASTLGQTPSRPNIVVIMLDDLGKEGLGTYYRRTYDTPNIDLLAEQGVRFSRFYTHPRCVPTRASLLTGLYPPRTGWVSNNKVIVEGDCLDPAFGTFVQLLQGAGYATAAAGKWHLCPFEVILDHPDELGFDEWILSPNGPHWGAKTWVNGSRAPELETEDIFIADKHTDFAIDFIRRNAANPFFLYFPTKLPHKRWSKTPDNQNRTLPDGDRRYFPGMVAYADKLIGRLLDAIEAAGVEQQTIVIFLTDNGTSRLLPGGGKGGSTESGINNPLIVKWPGTARPGATRHELADVTDLYPTILEMAGVTAPAVRDGHSLVPLLAGSGTATGRQWIYAQNEDRFAIRKRDWKLREGQQLFNLLHDPFEASPILPGNDTRFMARKRAELELILSEQGLVPGGQNVVQQASRP